jgi:hypothetical protein
MFSRSALPGEWVQYFPDGMSGDAWYSKILAKMDEPSLFERKDEKEVSAYRFLWLRGDHEPVGVRIKKTGNNIRGRITRLSGTSGHSFTGIVDQREFTVSAEEWSKLQEEAVCDTLLGYEFTSTSDRSEQSRTRRFKLDCRRNHRW